jgi:hypothetical protein
MAFVLGYFWSRDVTYSRVGAAKFTESILGFDYCDGQRYYLDSI